MSQSLPAGKPLLGKREIFPTITIDVPNHFRGHLVGALPARLQDGNHLFVPQLVVLLQFGNSSPVMVEGVAVAREYPVDMIVIDFIQAFQVLLQRVAFFRPKGNIGSDVVEDVVSGEEDFGPRLIKAHMAPRMARSFNTQEGVFSYLKTIPFPQEGKIEGSPQLISAAGVFRDGSLNIRFREAVLKGRNRYSFPVVRIIDDLGIWIVEIDLR